MAIYNYKGLNRSGKEIRGQVTADGLAHAKTKIRNDGIMLIDLKEQSSKAASTTSGFSFGTGVSVDEISMMTRQLATLVKAKVQIVEAIKSIGDQTDNPKLKIVLSEVRQKVNEGNSLAKSLSDYPKIFDNVFINMIEAGEQSGTLDVVFGRLADFSEARMGLKHKTQSAVMYPAIMIFFSFMMFMIIFTFVIPRITKIFADLGKELPLQTRICIGISDFLISYWPLVILGIISSPFLFNKWVNTASGRARWDKFLLKAPIIGELTMMINVNRFCSTLSTLLNSGVPHLIALRIVKNIIGNIHMQEAVENARISLSEGAKLYQPLKESGLFPGMVTHMISLGEQSGELEEMLEIIASSYEEQVKHKLNGLTSLLEPLILVGMGLAVAFIVFSVVVPMMKLNSV